jgi:DNA-binding transcriptional MocR family regulator
MLRSAWTRQRFVTIAREHGVLVRPSDDFAIGSTPPAEAVRISLSSPVAREDLVDALQRLGPLLARAG